MAIDSTSRRVLYAGNGTTKTFAFTFKVFKASDVAVFVGPADGATTTELVQGSEYTVDMNAKTVNVTVAPAKGYNLAITSNVPITQPMELTPYGGFNPETLNDSADRQIIISQQLQEQSNRALFVPITSGKTNAQVLTEILDIAASAQTFSDQARETLEETRALKVQVETETVQQVLSAGEQAVAGVTAEGVAQRELLEQMRESILLDEAVIARTIVWVTDAPIAEGVPVTLPQNGKYLVRHGHVLVSFDGLSLAKGIEWDVVDEGAPVGTKIKFLFNVPAGSQIQVFVAPLGRGEVAEAMAKVEGFENALADLSSKVVYKSAEV